MGITADKLLKGFLIFGFLYFLFEAILHLSNIRLSDTGLAWSESSKAYAGLINRVLGSFELAISILCYKLQGDLKKYSELVKISGIWTILHAAILIILSLGNDYTGIFAGMPSLYVWAPFYNQYVFFEAGLLIFYTLVVFSWSRKNG